ncbi:MULTISPECIES: TRAP transporter large permease subunit [unclassified Chelatococcus]|uniref:TRAP transporter large permease n=1 Tax=unclassified Chelatococcus TaxID=2638111 RepID=UPI001BCFF17F|nr:MULTISPECIES: TRAP transporter large permease subunit [unclassified Chelatococcus]MBS7700163.1 TRAP transporter large permease subunit [Chelatococcus sp. YT9]MBX3556856.1 TRAP transporter large permease subunit [Chelatococcus sp.]
MIEFIAQNLAPIMFASLVIMLLMGSPVAFSLAANGLLFFFIAVELAPLAPQTITVSWPLLQAMPDRVLGVLSNEVLLAIPFFTFMGYILERSGMAEDLLDTIGQVFGTVRGGIAYAVIFVGALLAATTGVVAASVISMGLISLPIMLRYGYDRRIASGVIAASGTLAQIIPPSLVLIVMADQLGQSVGNMYAGAFLPGLMLAGGYGIYVFARAMLSPSALPGLPVEAIVYREPGGERGLWQLGLLVLFSAVAATVTLSQTAVPPGPDFVILAICLGTVIALIIALLNRLLGSRSTIFIAGIAIVLSAAYVWLLNSGYSVVALYAEVAAWAVGYNVVVAAVERSSGLRLISGIAEQVTFVLVPPLLLIFLVLGTIFIGVATPTEGGAMGAAGALILALIKRFLDKNPARLNLTSLRQATESTAKLTTFAIFIVLGARVFSLTFYGVNGHLWVEHLLVSLPGGEIGFLLVVNLLVFFLAFFLDYFEIAFILIPLLVPAAQTLGIDLVWFGVLLSINLQTSFMHPPFGFALFYLRSVAARVPYLDKLTGKTIAPVTTGQIYWGAIPFLLIQLLMVGITIAFPQIVTHYKSAGQAVDPAAVQDRLDNLPGGDAVPAAKDLPPLFD